MRDVGEPHQTPQEITLGVAELRTDAPVRKVYVLPRSPGRVIEAVAMVADTADVDSRICPAESTL